MTEEDKKKQQEQQQAQQQAPVKPSARDSFMTGFGSRYKDIDQADDDAVYGQMGKDYEELDRLRNDRESFNKLMKDEDGLNAGLMNGILTGRNVDGSKFSVIRYIFGDHPDLAKAALEGDEVSLEKLIELRNQEIADEAQRKTDEAAEEDAMKQKIEAEDAALDASLKKAGYKPDQVADLIKWIYDPKEGFCIRALAHELTEEDFDKIIRIIDYDGDIARADEEGYKRGKSERIAMNREMHRGDGRPTNLGGGGGTGKRQSKDPTLAAIDRMSQV